MPILLDISQFYFVYNDAAVHLANTLVHLRRRDGRNLSANRAIRRRHKVLPCLMKCTTLYIKELDVDAPHQISAMRENGWGSA